MLSEQDHDREHRIGMMVQNGADESVARVIAAMEVRRREEKKEYDLD